MQPGGVMFLYYKMQSIFCGFSTPGFGCLIKNAFFVIFLECHRHYVNSDDHANGMLRGFRELYYSEQCWSSLSASMVIWLKLAGFVTSSTPNCWQKNKSDGWAEVLNTTMGSWFHLSFLFISTRVCLPSMMGI